MTFQQARQRLKKVKIIYEPYARFKKVHSAKKRRKFMLIYGEKLLKITADALNSSSISWFAAFGTLLGFVREKDFINWDLDIDIGILKDSNFSWTALEDVMSAAGLRKVKQFTFKGEITEQTYSYNGATVDFFRYAVNGENMTANIYCRRKGNAYQSDFEFSVMKSTAPLINGITQIEIRGADINIPLNYEEYLSVVYGENWRTPDRSFSHQDRETVEAGEYAQAQFFKYKQE